MNSGVVRRFRTVAFWEGVSYLVLLGIAMPLKYFGGMPMAVTVVGWIHGVLFILYCLALLQAYLALKWPFKRATLYFIAALLPVAPFIVERRLKDEEGLVVENT